MCIPVGRFKIEATTTKCMSECSSCCQVSKVAKGKEKLSMFSSEIFVEASVPALRFGNDMHFIQGHFGECGLVGFGMEHPRSCVARMMVVLMVGEVDTVRTSRRAQGRLRQNLRTGHRSQPRRQLRRYHGRRTVRLGLYRRELHDMTLVLVHSGSRLQRGAVLHRGWQAC